LAPFLSMKKSQFMCGIISTAAAAIAVCADLLLEFTPNPAHLFSLQSVLLDVDPGRMLVGHYLGLFAILAQSAGIWFLFGALSPGGLAPTITVVVLEAIAYSVGAVFHSTAVFIGLTVHAQQLAPEISAQDFTSLLNSYYGAILGIVAVTAAAPILGAIRIALLIRFRPTLYPRNLVWLNPLSFMIFFYVLGRLIPTVGLVVVPAILNLSNLCFFLLSIIALRGRVAVSG